MKIKSQIIPKELETSVKEKYNCYEVEKNIVSTGEREFKSIKEVEEYKKEKIEELKYVFNII